MGFSKAIGDRVRGFFAREPEQQALMLTKAGRYSGQPGMGYGSLLDFYGASGLGKSLEVGRRLMERYIDYENMEEYPEIAASYDLYADDSTQPDMLKNVSIWATSPDRQVEESLNRLLHKTLRVEDDIWPLARTLSKYGNLYGESLVTADGVIGINYLPVPTVRRIETQHGRLLGFVQDTHGRFDNVSVADFTSLLKRSVSGEVATGVSSMGQMVTAFEPWEITHWRLASKHLRSVYGYGVGESARWIWKRLMMFEDAALIFKLTRSPSRLAFYIDTGALDQDRAIAYVDKVARRLKRKKFINNSTGKVDFSYNALTMNEDFFLPTREGRDSTRIDMLSGADYQSVDDLEYFLSKLFAALKVPKAYLGRMEDASKSVLSQEDVQFARAIMRIQREITNGFRKVARVHLSALGIKAHAVDYEIQMTVPSSIFELARMEVWSARADLSDRLKENIPISWILQRIFDFSEDEAAKLMTQRDADKVREAEVEAVASAKADDIQAEAEKKRGGGNEDVSLSGRKVMSIRTDRDFDRMMSLGVSRKDFQRLDDKLGRLMSENVEVRKRVIELKKFTRDIRSMMHGRSSQGSRVA
jgi:hypothetical protein